MNLFGIATLLAGGLGTRLWPASRKSYCEQFSNFIGGESLFQKSARRLTSSDIWNLLHILPLQTQTFVSLLLNNGRPLVLIQAQF